MVGSPDSKNPPAAPAAEAPPDLTLNGPMPFAEVDAVSDLRLQSEAESLSIFVPEDAPLEQRDSDSTLCTGTTNSWRLRPPRHLHDLASRR
jgi:hypothetical protein